ncbi:unnamed protein product [Blepharisma stoltei]|uniref:Cyclic nucleotide-binding domain-containing protein n=1 Tax=Blepharisma stoltei TaxID=1481888 RepID=A0AAU9JX82_9CILI|nr:unnamed protein product [Blepharisma stoltei]
MSHNHVNLNAFLVHPKSRTQQDINEIMESTQEIEFFKKITNEKSSNQIHMACCQVMTVEEFSRGSRVISYGEMGDKFYIVLRGSLTVAVPLKVYKPISEVIEILKSPESIAAAKIDNKEATKLREFLGEREKALRNEPESRIDENEMIQVEELKEVGGINPGQAFGELSLISDKPRAATITAKEHCILAVLCKQDFKKVLGSIADRTLNERVAYLQSLPLFSAWTKQSLQKISYYFIELSVGKAQYVYKEGNNADYVYFVRSGEFKLIKNQQNESPGYAERKVKSGSQFLSSTLESATLKLSLMKKVHKNIKLQIAIKGENEVFGYEEIIENVNLRMNSCICNSIKGELYAMSRTDFKQRVSNQETLKYLKEKYKFDQKRNNERIEQLKNVEEIKQELTHGNSLAITERHLEEKLKRKYYPMLNKLKTLRERVHLTPSINTERLSFTVPWTYPKNPPPPETCPSPYRGQSMEIKSPRVTEESKSIPRSRSIQKERKEKTKNREARLKRYPPPNFMHRFVGNSRVLRNDFFMGGKNSFDNSMS